MSQDNQDPLLTTKQIRGNQSLISNLTNDDPHLYDLPNLSHVTKGVLCRLTAVSIVCIIFLAAEIVGGILANSLAILSDAAHMFSDMSGFFISIFSIWLGQRPASEKMSFGYHRAEVIGALASIILIWGLTILLFYEATIRIINKTIVDDPLIMLITAGFGLFCNLVMAKVLHSSHDHGGTNVMHQCSGHDHGHGHSHGHSHGHKHTHTHDYPHQQQIKQKKSNKKKVHIKKKKNTSSAHGLSLLVVEQKIDSSSSSNQEQQFIEEAQNEDSSYDQQQQQETQSQKNMKKTSDIVVDHDAHSENCDHDHEHEHQNGQISIGIDQNNHSHDKHDHSHDHDHDHEHNHNHDNNKKIKSSNLTNINEQDNYNLKAAMIHVIGDILQSIGVLIAAILIYILGQEKNSQGEIIFTYWQYADPICTYLFSILVLCTTFGIAKECLRVLMEGTPSGLVMEEFAEKVKQIPKVREVHDLHIWSLSVGKPAMSAHIVCSESPEYVLRKATKLCRQFGIYHSTIQIESLERQGQTDYIKCEHNLHN